MSGYTVKNVLDRVWNDFGNEKIFLAMKKNGDNYSDNLTFLSIISSQHKQYYYQLMFLLANNAQMDCIMTFDIYTFHSYCQ